MPFAITGTANGQPVYWRKWTGASRAGRPKWVLQLTPKCLYVDRRIAEQTVAGHGSAHFAPTMLGLGTVTGIEVEEITTLPD